MRFEVLGPVRALRAGTAIDLVPAKQRAVLAVLLLNAGHPVPVGRIVDVVWGDDPPENGPNVVQKYVAGLRRVLDPGRAPRTPGELIALTAGGYVLRTEATDLADFRAAVARATAERDPARLRQALARWHGPAFDGVSGAYFDAARDRLAEEHATAWERWAQYELDRGAYPALVPELVRLIAEFPLREGLRAQLMIALHRGGRQAEALAVFRDARRFLRDEFGVEPGERLQEAHRDVLRGAPAPAPVPPAQSAQPRPGGASPGEAPFRPADLPPPRRGPALLEIVVAAVLPIVLCGAGAWIYFVVAGVRRRDRRQFGVAAGYLALFLLMIVLLAVDPSPETSDNLSGAEWSGLLGIAGVAAAGAVHGALLAAHPGDTERRRELRARAYRLAMLDPERARRIGVGRPDLHRDFDDGGLVDVNHVPGHELARLPGISSAAAHRIVVDRTRRGPYQRAEDLVTRGLISPATLYRLGTRVICLPPGEPAARPP